MAEENTHKGTGHMSTREAGARGGEASWGTDRGPYEKPGPDKGEAYGVAAVTQALHGIGFPASKEDLLKQAGSKTIQYHKGHPVKLADLIHDFDQADFPTMAEVVQQVSRAAKQEGLSGGQSK